MGQQRIADATRREHSPAPGHTTKETNVDILIRNINPELVARIDREAEIVGISRQQILADLLTERFATPPLVLGWIAYSRPGELAGLADPNDSDDPDRWTCPECSQDMHTPHIGHMSNGSFYGPVCGACAVSE